MNINRSQSFLLLLFPLQYKSCCIRRHAGLFSKTCLDYKTCHTIYSKTRLKYRTQQPSVDVTMTSSLLSSKKKRFKTRVQQQTQQTFTQRPGWNKRIWGEIPFLSNKDPVTCIEEERVFVWVFSYYDTFPPQTKSLHEENGSYRTVR